MLRGLKDQIFCNANFERISNQHVGEVHKDSLSEMKKVSVISFPTHMNEKVHAMKNTGCGNQNIK